MDLDDRSRAALTMDGEALAMDDAAICVAFGVALTTERRSCGIHAILKRVNAATVVEL